MATPATATILKAWQDTSNAYLSATVNEAGTVIEYIVSTPLTDSAGNTLNTATLKENLRLALQARRNAQFAGTTLLGAITGTLSV